MTTERKHSLTVGDAFEWQGRETKITHLLHVGVVLEGVEDAVCVPVGATRIEVFDDNQVGGFEK